MTIMNPVVNLAFHLNANITHDIGLQIACLILAILFHTISAPTYEVSARRAHTMYTFPKCPGECVKCIVCERECASASLVSWAIETLTTGESHRQCSLDAKESTTSSSHFLHCLRLFSSLSINAPWLPPCKIKRVAIGTIHPSWK